MSVQTVWGRFGTSGANNIAFTGVLSPEPVTTSQIIPQPIGTALTIRNFKVRVSGSVGSGKWLTFTFRKNGATTALVATVTDPATEGHDYVNQVAYAAGDTIDMIQTSPGGLTAVTVYWSFEIVSDTDNVYVFGGQQGGGMGSDAYTRAPVEHPLFGYTLAAGCVTQLMPCAGTITSLTKRTSTAPGAGTAYLCFKKNGVTQNGSGGTPDTRLLMTGAGLQYTTAVSLHVDAGDVLDFEGGDYAGTPNYGTYSTVCWTFVPDTAGVQPIFGTLSNTYNPGYGFLATATRNYNNAEDQHTYGGPSPVRITGMRVKLDYTPYNSGATYTFTLRKNGADTGLHVLIGTSETAGSAVADPPIEINEDDDLQVQRTATGTPQALSASTRIAWTGQELPSVVRGSLALGYQATARKSRAVLFSLDGNANELNDEGTLEVAGDFEATGVSTLPGLNISALIDAMGT